MNIQCCEDVFLSNSIDEAREGFGDTIIITRFFRDNSIELRDFGTADPGRTTNMRKNITGNLFSVGALCRRKIQKTIPAATMV